MSSTIERTVCLLCNKKNLCTWEHEGSTWRQCKTVNCDNCTAVIVTNNLLNNTTTLYNKPLIDGEFAPLIRRNITLDTVRFCDIKIGTLESGKKSLIFNYKDKDQIVWQKINVFVPDYEKKIMFSTGQSSGSNLLFLQNKWEPNPNLFIVITEGEIDAASVVQAQDYQYPVVSVPNGANTKTTAAKLAANLKWLMGFKYVVLWFDNDEAGRCALDECIPLFEPGKVRVVKNDKYKDANDILQKLPMGFAHEEIRRLVFFAVEIKPDSIKSASQIIEEGINKTVYGPALPWPSMNKASYGAQPCSIHLLVGTSGVGKTEIITKILFNFIEQNIKSFYMNFEQSPAESMKRLVGTKLCLDLTDPDVKWNQDLINNTAKEFDNKIWFYDKAGDVSMKDLFDAMRYEAKAHGVKCFVLDNLKAIGVALDNKKAEEFFNKLESLMKELETFIFLLSHVAQDKYKISTHIGKNDKETTSEEMANKMLKPGLDWNSGRMPTSPEGYNIISAKPHMIWAIARNQLAEDEKERNTTRMKVIKSRFNRKMMGKEWKLYSDQNGLIIELDEFDNSAIINNIF